MQATTKQLQAMNIEHYKKDYDDNGFIRVRGLLGGEEMQTVYAALERYEREIIPTLEPKDYVMEKDGKSVRNLWRMNQHDPFFQSLAEKPELLSLVGILVNGEPVLKGVETFNKPARTGSGVPAHQDNAYFCRKPADVLTIWIATDPVTRENGPVTYMKGSHKLGHLEHTPSGVAGNSMGLAELPDKKDYPEWEGLLEPGDALIHHCEVIHYSSPNTTEFPRRGLLMVFCSSHAEECPDLNAAYARGGAL